MSEKQTRLLPRYPFDIPAIENYPLPKIARDRKVVSIIYRGEAVSASVGFSGNKLYRSVDYTTYRDALGWLFKERIGGEWDIHRYSFGVRARFFLGNRRKVDIDNLLKPIMDAGTHIIWADDSQITEIYSIVLRDDPTPRIEILIYAIEDFVDYHHLCLYCGKELHGKEGYGGGLTKKYCSNQCRDNALRSGKERICEWCSKPFWSGRFKGQKRRVNKRFCSRDCYDTWFKTHGNEMVKRINKMKGGCYENLHSNAP